ncbi:unnamed protein product (macronuclear) [Paramecium tetraurelia]|uniref:Uncharacterized protein n=1 Tax=Paramecium tetraurelia TaxID=5888 RepID=A0EAQ2_PARTE|nr:uncharacterized protein GSPATT00025103001 [Paramecium tetraurelia]CAK92369.1 unnamed protein product [Paramecium tetraurelia]|eukprot:XP_001459766.1 hypothetical protein (macronuclear) [Paramecium tetraurelia strain d4-2]
MGSSCISNQKDTTFEDLYFPQVSTQYMGIQNINQTIIGDFQQVKLLKESLEEGIQISNIQTIVITPSCEQEGAKLVSQLVKLGNHFSIISKRVPEIPPVSERSISKKGILKNKQDINVTQSADGGYLFPVPKRKNGKNIKFQG